jgi:hypothetical protein
MKGRESVPLGLYLLGDGGEDRHKLVVFVEERSKPIGRDQLRIDELFQPIAGLFQLLKAIAHLAGKFGIGPGPMRLAEIHSDRDPRTQ